MRRSYLEVEGPHDVEFVARLLPPSFKRVQMLADLDPALRCLVPAKFPHRDDLLRRVPVPTFFADPSHTIAIHSAIGVDKLAAALEESLAVLDAYKISLDDIGVILDADDREAPPARHAALRAKLERLPRLAAWPHLAGDVHPGPPQCGAFILPDNQQAGSLEDLLLEASKKTFPGLHDHAAAYVGAVVGDKLEALGLRASDLKALRKPSGTKKATLACVASMLRPGKALQNAIQDCRWLDTDALKLPGLQAVQAFIFRLLGLDRARGDAAL